MTAAVSLVPMVGTATFAEETRDLLLQLAARSWAGDVYLAGSAALAAYLGHRPVRDLDLMSGTRRLESAERRDLLQDLLAMDEGVRVETARDGYLSVRCPSSDGRGVAVRLFHYPYPLVDPEEELAGLPLASALDLALMKLGAIVSRGDRRDFVDLHLLCRRLPLDHVLARSPEKFGHVRDFPLQALKGLADLASADGEPMPRLAVPLAWEEVETWVRSEVRALARARLGLDPLGTPGSSLASDPGPLGTPGSSLASASAPETS